jgi:hypothetical protein
MLLKPKSIISHGFCTAAKITGSRHRTRINAGSVVVIPELHDLMIIAGTALAASAVIILAVHISIRWQKNRMRIFS